MKAMVLAAGHGTRLQPLSNFRPKSLMPILDKPALDLILTQLRRHGAREVVINLHHLGHLIESHVGDGRAHDLEVHYSPEQELLGTGGALAPVRDFFSNEDQFLLLNSDIVTDIHLGAVLQQHLQHRPDATMVLLNAPDVAPNAAVEVDEQGWVLRIAGLPEGGYPSSRKGLFTGLHVITPRVLDYIPAKIPSCINRDIYSAMLRDGCRIRGCFVRGFWSELGTPSQYLETNFRVLRELSSTAAPMRPDWFPPLPVALKSGLMVGEGLDIGPSVELVPPLYLGPDAKIGQNAKVGPDVIVGGGATVGPGVRLKRTVVWSASEISQSASDTIAAGAMLVPATGPDDRPSDT